MREECDQKRARSEAGRDVSAASALKCINECDVE